MIFHYTEVIGARDRASISFRVSTSELSFFIIVDSSVVRMPDFSVVSADGFSTYTYRGFLPAGSLFEFYYDVPLSQPDKFSTTTVDTMVSKALCRLNRVRYATGVIDGTTLSDPDRVSTIASIRILRLLENSGNIIVAPIPDKPRPVSSVDILADFYLAVFNNLRKPRSIESMVRGRGYYIVTTKTNTNINLQGEDHNSFLSDKISYHDFNLYTLPYSLGGYTSFSFCGDGVFDGPLDVDGIIPRTLPKLPSLSSVRDPIFLGSLAGDIAFRYTPYQDIYRYQFSGVNIEQIPVDQVSYTVVVLFSETGVFSSATVLNATEYSVSDYIGKIEVPLQVKSGYYYISLQSSSAVVVRFNDFYPYDTSLINLGIINPSDFWTQEDVDTRDNSVLTYKTTGRVVSADVGKGITKMEFMFL